MHSIAVYRVERCFGGPEDGGWWYDLGIRADEDALVALGGTATCADMAAAQVLVVQAELDRTWNVGEHARPLDSVLSPGRYEAHRFEGWPPPAFPPERPLYE